MEESSNKLEELDMHYSSSFFDGGDSTDISGSSDHVTEKSIADSLESQISEDVMEPYMYEPLASASSDGAEGLDAESQDIVGF